MFISMTIFFHESFVRIRVWFLLLLLATPIQVACADVVVYTVPNTELSFVLLGDAKINPGRTLSLRHARGTLHFGALDCKLVRTASKQKRFGVRRRQAMKLGTAEAHLDLALWCVENGMISEADNCLSKAWKTSPTNKRVLMMAKLVKYRRATVPMSPSVVKEMREFVKSDRMKVSRSRHFVLLHDTSDEKDPKYKKTIAQHRLDLLEQVYDTFYMKYALEGFPLKVPREPMRVVLFDEHADYLNFVRILSPQLKMAAGFYSPKPNIAIYYRQRSNESSKQLDNLAKSLAKARDKFRRSSFEGRGELIRLSKTLEMLIDIDGENREIEVVTHEATHQLAANSGLLDREKFQVRWAHEGLASYFESPKEATWAGIGAVNEERIAFYRVLARDPEHSSIEFVVTDQIFDKASSELGVHAAYGQSWALTHFLTKKHLPKLVNFYRKMAVDDFEAVHDEAWRTKVMDTFRECFGDLVTLEQDWRSYMNGLETDLEKIADDL